MPRTGRLALLLLLMITFVIAVPTQAQDPSQLVIVIGEEPPNLDPGEGTIIALNTYRNTYEALVTRDPQTGEILPELATSWELMDDTTWRFHLREGVMFHDGTPFNAEAAAWNIGYLFNPDNNKHILGTVPEGISATAVDEYTLDITTPDPFPILPRALFFANMASPTAIQADTEHAFRTMVGTGPYAFKEWVPGERIVLTRNPDYWGGASEIDEVVYVWRNESSVRSAMVDAGEADIAAALDSRDTSTGNVVAINISETPFIRMDLPNPPLSDIRIRQAICMSIDRQNIADKLFGGYATPASQLVAPDVVGYSPDVPVYPFDLDAAKALVDAARADGVPVDNQITVYLSSGSGDITIQMMVAIVQWTSEIGLNLNIELNEPARHLAIARELPPPPDRLAIFWGQHGNEVGDAYYTIQAYYMPGGIHSTVDDPTFVEMFRTASQLSGPERQDALADVMLYQYEHVVATCPIVYMQYIYKLADGVTWQPRPDHLILAKDVVKAD
ncbi:MAG: hypothetical protein IT319_17525 [Anaerolineae bacterium]|nr:hypothetical protein [Anaerolineae bacterium]